MRATIEDNVLYLHPADVPPYKKGGSVVRNSYFWALRSIAARSLRDKPWEFESEVWFALCRMLISFFESGYLATTETQLEFLDGTEIPEALRQVSTWIAPEEVAIATEPIPSSSDLTPSNLNPSNLNPSSPNSPVPKPPPPHAQADKAPETPAVPEPPPHRHSRRSTKLG